MTKITALVTCAGAMPAISIINALKRQNEIPVNVVAVDANPLSAGFCLSDRSCTVPAVLDGSYMPTIREICRREGVGIIFPVVDEEQLEFAENRESFHAAGISVVANDPAAVKLSRDKFLTYQWCLQNGVPVPATSLSGAPATSLPGFPLIVKPRRGQATRGVFKVRDQRELEFFTQYVSDAMVQEFIDGQEYTIDVLTDFDGEVISIVPKARIETKAGMQVKGKTVNDAALIQYAAALAEKLRLGPRCNIQCIVANGRNYLIEINPKFPASLPLTVAAGVNAPLLLVKMRLGQKVPPMIGQFRDGLLMMRYWQEVFVEP